MFWLLGSGLIVAGVFTWFYAFANMNYEAPSPDDWGNYFVYPSYGLVVLGLAVIGWQVIALIAAHIAH